MCGPGCRSARALKCPNRRYSAADGSTGVQLGLPPVPAVPSASGAVDCGGLTSRRTMAGAALDQQEIRLSERTRHVLNMDDHIMRRIDEAVAIHIDLQQ